MKKLFSFFLVLLYALMYSANFYWVGGSGKWSEISHWRTTSGGTSIPSVVPSTTDDVFFDVNSGFTSASKTVTLDVTGICHNITFSGSAVAPTFTQASNQMLYIYGSSEWQNGMGNIGINMIYYKHTGFAKTIKSNGVIFGTNSSDQLIIEEESSISLSDALSINGKFNHVAGTFITGGNDVTFGYYYDATLGTKPRTLNLGASQVYMTYIYATFLAYNTALTVVAGTSHIHFVNFQNGYNTPAYGLRPSQGQSYYDVTFEGTGGIINHTATSPVVSFNQVEFKGDGVINGSNNFKRLIFAPTKTYKLASSRTQTITESLTAYTAPCGGWSTITSGTDGTQASIVAGASVVINVSGAILKDLNASGGAFFSAVSSIDNGNNTGWTIPTTTGQNLYWVGGSGNWNDKSHWSSISGGSGGYCVPGPSDNTFFDNGSGFTSASKTVTIDNVSYTHNVTFSGSATVPTLTQTGSQTLNIYGSSEWQTGMSIIDISNIYYRNTNEVKTIKSNGVKVGTNTNNPIYFEEKNTINLSDSFFLTGALNHNAGTFNTNNYNVTLGFAYDATKTTTAKTLNLGSSQVYMTNNSAVFRANTTSLTINAGTSNIHFTTFDKGYNIGSYGLIPFTGQTYYDVTFESTGGQINNPFTGANVNFNTLDFRGDATINGNNKVKNLLFSPVKNIIFQSGKTLTVTDVFTANTPQCAGWASFSASTVGTRANFVVSSTAVVNISGTIIKDIDASGGKVLNATNSIDGGNNLGWIISSYAGQNLYWVGGSGTWNDKSHWAQTSGGAGGYCVPGPADNTFFDNGSGFTSASKTVTVDNTAYTHNITFYGSSVVPIFKQSGTQILNIYGSSEWQTGMANIDITNIYYRHTNEAKTIKSNGVKIGTTISNNVYSEEGKSITLSDALNLSGSLYHNSGTFNTNNFDVTIGNNFDATTTATAKSLILGSSQIYLTNSSAIFKTSSSAVTVDAGTSTIHFTNFLSGYNTGIYGFTPYIGQTFYNLIFESTGGQIYNTASSTNVNFNKVEFRGDGSINGNNNFNSLIFSASKTYTLKSGNTQTIADLTLGGNTCFVTIVKSSVSGTRANVSVTGSNTEFNFGNIKDINAVGQTLHFGEQSTVATQNNNNITYDQRNSGGFSGLVDWGACHRIDLSDATSYIIDTGGFYGNQYTTYKWYKTGGNNSSATTVISTANQLDIRTFGYGKYKVEVTYISGLAAPCVITEEIAVNRCLVPRVNPNLRIRVQ